MTLLDANRSGEPLWSSTLTRMCELLIGLATMIVVGIDDERANAVVVSLKSDSYRLKDRDRGRVPTDDAA